MFISIIQHIRENAAGAAASSVEGMWEVGVDVLEGYRNARPAWVDTFGTILDGSSVYQEIVSGMT